MQPLWEPPKLGDGERLGRYLGDHAQLVERADGEAPSVIDSLLPLRARNDSGNKRPIDIELEDRGEGFEPENAIVDTRLPREAGEGVAFQKSDVRIRPLARDRDELTDALDEAAKLTGREGREARELAETETDLEPSRAKATKLKQKLFYHESEVDTDLVLAPVPTGVEIFYVLRSKESPETQVLELDLPGGARLRLVDGGGGAEVVEDGERVMSIAPPKAHDATGKEIPVSYDVDGDRLTVEVSHRGEDVLYPGLVDPVVEEQKDWETNPTVGYQGWAFSPNSPGFDGYTRHRDYGRGLTMEAPPGTLEHKAGVHSCYEAPGNAFVYRGEFWYSEHEPYNSVVTRGLALPDSDNSLDAGVENGGRAREDVYGTDLRNAGICARAGCAVDGTQGNRMTFQLDTDGAGYRSRRILAHLGGARVFLHDYYNPAIASLTHDPPLGPGGWTNRLDHKVAIRGTDGGLGVKKFFFLPPPGIRQDREDVNCTAQCPREKTEEFIYALTEGAHAIKAQVQDNVERNSPISEWRVGVDLGNPVIKAAAFEPPKPCHGPGGTTLHVEATDEDPSGPRAGVQKIETRLNDAVDPATGEPRYFHTQLAPAGCIESCPLTHDFRFEDADLPEGTNKVTVRVTDNADNVSERSVEVRADREGPIQTVTGTLKEAQAQAVTDEGRIAGGRYTVDVNATDGTLVTNPRSGVRSIEILVDGVRRDFAEQLCPTGSCPMNRSWTFDTEDVGVGRHTVAVRTTDHAGSLTEELIEVNVDPLTGDLPRYEFENYSMPGNTELRVNVASGNLLVRQNEYRVDMTETTVLDYALERYYNSQAANKSPLGRIGWTMGLGQGLRLAFPAPATVRLEGPSGFNLPFTAASGGGYVAPPGLDVDLLKNADGSWTIVESETDERLNFDAQGLLSSKTDEDGGRLDFGYDGEGLLNSLEDSEGRSFSYDHDDDGRLDTLTDAEGEVHRYGHDDAGNLTFYESPDGGETDFSYDPLSGKLNRIRYTRNGESEDTRITYDDVNRVQSIIRDAHPLTGQGDETTYDYGDGATVSVDSNDRESSYSYDSSGMVTESRTGDEPPALALSGDLTDRASQQLAQEEDYELNADAGGRSALERIEISVDRGVEMYSEQADCEDPCADLAATFAVPTGESRRGERVIRVIATEASGDSRTKILRVGVPEPPPLETEPITEADSVPDPSEPIEGDPEDEGDPGLEPELAPGPSGAANRGAAMAAGAPSPSGDFYGISDEKPNAISKDFKDFTDLEVAEVRKIVPWNVTDHVRVIEGVEREVGELARFRAWYDKAVTERVNAGLRPLKVMVTFQFGCPVEDASSPDGSYTGQCFQEDNFRNGPTSFAAYNARLDAFRARFPGVSRMSAMNEPNQRRQPSYRRPVRAAKYTYWLQMSGACPPSSCRVVAGEFSTNPRGTWDREARRYREALLSLHKGNRRRLPAAWGLHPYGDVLRGSRSSKPNRDTKKLIAIVPDRRI